MPLRAVSAASQAQARRVLSGRYPYSAPVSSELPGRPSGPPVAVSGLRLAACLVAGQGLVLVAVAGVELASLNASRVGLALTTAGFFLVCGLGLAWAGRGLWTAESWSRGPVVAAQLLVLGVAWSTRSLPWLALLLAAWAVLVLVLVLRRSATEALGE